MKATLRLVPVIAFCALTGLISCEQQGKIDQATGTAEFSVTMPSAQVSKSEAATDSLNLAYQILISVEDMSGAAILTDKVVPLYTFGKEFISESIEIKAGQYKLTKFMVISKSGVILYASPKAGSALAYLSAKPLPFNFSITTGQTTKILPEVLTVGSQEPARFGYAAFGVEIINPLQFYVICILDNPLALSPTQMTTAGLTVGITNGWRANFKLQAAVNQIIIRGGAELYDLVWEKEGFSAQKRQVALKELQAATKENPLVLKIPVSAQYKTIVLQPGPEKGKDAMVSNLEPEKNFGSHKYFEATFLTEPMLTVMRSNRSLIAFNLDTLPKSAIIKRVVLTLYYDVPIPFDNTIFKPDVYPASGIEWFGGVLRQVTAPWEENKVTWNTQPPTTEANQVFVPPFIRNCNYIEIDVTKLFLPVANSTTPNYGLLFKLWPSEKFPGFRFASSDFAEPKMRPRLTVSYTVL